MLAALHAEPSSDSSLSSSDSSLSKGTVSLQPTRSWRRRPSRLAARPPPPPPLTRPPLSLPLSLPVSLFSKNLLSEQMATTQKIEATLNRWATLETPPSRFHRYLPEKLKAQLGHTFPFAYPRIGERVNSAFLRALGAIKSTTRWPLGRRRRRRRRPQRQRPPLMLPLPPRSRSRRASLARSLLP